MRDFNGTRATRKKRIAKGDPRATRRKRLVPSERQIEMMAILQEKGTPMNAADLVREIEARVSRAVGHSAVLQYTKSLEAEGWLKLDENERFRRYTLTRAGVQALERARDYHARM